VTLCDLDTDGEERYTICGVLESEPDQGLISVHAPLSKAMLGKEEGDQFTLRLPVGSKEYEVVAIEYLPVFSLKKQIRGEKEFSFK
jgi:transcription elongation factor GreA